MAHNHQSQPTQPPRLLIITHDVVGNRMAGPGIRSWELARVLNQYQPVTLIAPQPIDLLSPPFACGHYIWGNTASLESWLRQADVVFANGHVLQAHPHLADTPQPLALDLYDPTLLENLELFRDESLLQRQERYYYDQQLLWGQLHGGDFLICATERQRDLYIGALMLSGRITPDYINTDPLLHRLIDIVGFGLPESPPEHRETVLRRVMPPIGPQDPIILWTGGLWDWMDPVTLVQAMPQVISQHPQARLVFLAGPHPGNEHPMRMATRTREQAEALGLLERHIFFYHDWVPYTLRANFLLEADIAVSLHRNHLETRYAAVRSRILDHLWAGLPSIITEGDTAAGMLEAAGAALVVPMDDSHALAQAINRLLSNRLQADQLSQAARKLATSLTWRHVAGPLVRFCQQPYRTRVAASPPDPSPPPPGPQGIQGDDPSPPPAPESLLAACRNAAVQVQEQTWQLHPPDPATGRLGRPRQVLIDQTVRPFVMPLVEQQQHHNIAVLRSIYAINEIADHRRTSTGLSIGKVNQRLDETNQRIVPIEKRADQLEQHIRRIEHNHRVLCQQLAEVAEQLAGLEDADTQLLQTLLARSPSPPALGPHKHPLEAQPAAPRQGGPPPPLGPQETQQDEHEEQNR